MKKIVIAIDGYSACGKSTTARAVAQKLEYGYIDSGAMYRAVTLSFLRNHVSIADPHLVSKALTDIEIEFKCDPQTSINETYLNGLNVEKEIRSVEISENVSKVSAIPAVREKLVKEQQRMGKKKGVVMDGRDIGTVVFPDADLKVFMSADIQVRAERRQKELLDREKLVGLDKVIENLKKRDHLDSTRSVGPLKKAEDAFEIDTTNITFEEQVETILNLAQEKIEQL